MSEALPIDYLLIIHWCHWYHRLVTSGQYSRYNIPLACGCNTWKPNSIGRPFRCFAPKQSSNFATGCDVINRRIIGIQNKYQALLSSSRGHPHPFPVLFSLLLNAIWQCVVIVPCILLNIHWSLFLYRCTRRFQHGVLIQMLRKKGISFHLCLVHSKISYAGHPGDVARCIMDTWESQGTGLPSIFFRARFSSVKWTVFNKVLKQC